jgi:hypothetical protein
MSALRDFLGSLKEDLLGRRFAALALVLGVALVAAVAYAVLGGGSPSSSSTLAVTSSGSTTVAGVPVSPAPANPDQSISETTEGTSKQHKGSARNPFTPLPAAKGAQSSSAAASSATTPVGSPTGPSSSTTVVPSPAPSTPTTPAPAKPKQAVVHFHVTAQLGVVPPVAEGAPAQPAQLKTYTDMALDEPLPGKDNPQLVYLGVVLHTGNDVLFGLTGEAILHGSATCKPSATQCQAIELQVGQSETLEVLEANGTPVTYELKLLSIDKSISSASTTRVHDAFRAQAKAARELSRHAPKLSELRYSPLGGGLVLAAHPAFAARSSTGRAHGARADAQLAQRHR